MLADGSIVVADASVVFESLMIDGPVRAGLKRADVHVPHLVDSEILSALRRHFGSGRPPAAPIAEVLATYRSLGVMRHSVHGLSERIWELRDNVTGYDAAYVALAEAVDCPLVTTDGRLARAPGLRCAVTVLNG